LSDLEPLVQRRYMGKKGGKERVHWQGGKGKKKKKKMHIRAGLQLSYCHLQCAIKAEFKVQAAS